MSQSREITPEQMAQIGLSAAVRHLQLEVLEVARTLAPALQKMNPTQLRGLVNAFSAGQHDLLQQRSELAKFLAWRALRTAQQADGEETRMAAGNDWRELTTHLSLEIDRIEQKCAMAVASLGDKQAAYWQQHADVLVAIQNEASAQITAQFVHTLIRLAISQQQALAHAPQPHSEGEGDEHG